MAVVLEFDDMVFEMEDDVIESVNFKIDSMYGVDAQGKGAINGIGVVIKGIINEKVAKKMTEIAEWSITKRGSAKRFVAICINDDVVLRQYELNQVFVYKYVENYDTPDGRGRFELEVQQRLVDFKLAPSNVMISGGFDY